MEYILECFDCGSEYSPREVKYLCPECKKSHIQGNPLKGVLKVIYNYDKIIEKFDKENPDWDLFLPIEKEYLPSLPVGDTPFFRSERLSQQLMFKNIWIKNDALNPSGSLKDRASFLVVAEAKKFNENKIVIASTGNAASSLAAVCASEGIQAVVFIPKTAPMAKQIQVKLAGAELIQVDGCYDDAFYQSIKYSNETGCLNRNTAYNPFTIEGKKTVAFEMYEQNSYKIPDAILIPVGDGVIISGVYKGFADLKMAGLIDKMPKLICIQAKNSSAIHRYINSGVYTNEDSPTTIADSISVCAPCNAEMARFAVKESNGFSLTVTEEEIMDGQKQLLQSAGIFAEPSSAVVFPALRKIKENKLLNPDEQIVLLITGNGLKDIDTPLKYLSKN